MCLFVLAHHTLLGFLVVLELRHEVVEGVEAIFFAGFLQRNQELANDEVAVDRRVLDGVCSVEVLSHRILVCVAHRVSGWSGLLIVMCVCFCCEESSSM